MKKLFLAFTLSPMLITPGCGFELVKKTESEGEPKAKPAASNKITITADATAPQPAPGGGVNPMTEPIAVPTSANSQLGTCFIQADPYAQGQPANPSSVSLKLSKRDCADACNEQLIKLKLSSMGGGCLYVCAWNSIKLVESFYSSQTCIVAKAVVF